MCGVGKGIRSMKATVLIDNIRAEDLTPEWGLCIYIEYRDKKILLDTGASGRFLSNAEKLEIPIEQVDYGVLSHAHYDHADGMEAFFQKNKKADFFIREGSKENCYAKKFIFSRYIGIKKGTLEAYQERIRFVSGDYELMPGVFLIPQKTEGLARVGRKNGMYVKKGGFMRPDDFSHEQSLVLDTDRGLVIFNSCSHGGADTIIRETGSAFPGKHIYALAGGFHLFNRPEEEVRELAERILETGIEKIYTGHCTGKEAYGILKEMLGERAVQLRTGLVIEI